MKMVSRIVPDVTFKGFVYGDSKRLYPTCRVRMDVDQCCIFLSQ